MSASKPKHLVIDTSVYINYTRHQKLYRLVDAILTYDLVVYISPDLTDELEKNIPLTSAVNLPQFVYDGYLSAIKATCIYFEHVLQYANSPDLKDNFLWDLALQTKGLCIEVLLYFPKFQQSKILSHQVKWNSRDLHQLVLTDISHAFQKCIKWRR